MSEIPTQSLNFSDTMTFVSIVIALAVWIWVPKLIPRALGMIGMLLGIVYLVYRSSFATMASLPVRHSIAGVLSLSIVSMCVMQLRSQWRESKVGALEGNLRPIKVQNPQLFFTIQIGESDVKLACQPETTPEPLRFAYDAGLRVAMGERGPEVSTPVRDRAGNLVGEVIANHWKIYPPFCSDKNYDAHGLEMKDGAGHVVLQIRLFEDNVQLQGEWRTPFGSGLRLMALPDGNASITVWPNPESEQENQRLIMPIFRYPSSEFLGVKTT